MSKKKIKLSKEAQELNDKLVQLSKTTKTKKTKRIVSVESEDNKTKLSRNCWRQVGALTPRFLLIVPVASYCSHVAGSVKR